MKRITIPSVGTFDRLVHPALPGASERVEYRWVADHPARGTRNPSHLVRLAVTFGAALVSGVVSTFLR
jgi:hypothetical protein